MKKVGYFNRPSDNQLIVVIAKKNESDSDAIERVAKKHGVDPGKVTRGTPPDNPGHTAVMEDAEGVVTPEAFELAQTPRNSPIDIGDIVKAAESGDVGTLCGALRASLTKYEGTPLQTDPDDALFAQHEKAASSAKQLFASSL